MKQLNAHPILFAAIPLFAVGWIWFVWRIWSYARVTPLGRRLTLVEYLRRGVAAICVAITSFLLTAGILVVCFGVEQASPALMEFLSETFISILLVTPILSWFYLIVINRVFNR